MHNSFSFILNLTKAATLQEIMVTGIGLGSPMNHAKGLLSILLRISRRFQNYLGGLHVGDMYRQSW
jgi:hypothetical protein